MVEWVSVSRGVFLCNECAGIHRRPRNEAPRDEAPIVRSIRLDTWNTSHLEVHFYNILFYGIWVGCHKEQHMVLSFSNKALCCTYDSIAHVACTVLHASIDD